jgi:glucokinase
MWGGFFMILAGDIGATKTNLGFFKFEDGQLKTLLKEQLTNKNYSSFNEIVSNFVQSNNLEVTAACFGVAGPIRNERGEMTNLPWVIDKQELVHLLKIKNVWVINDLEANAYGISALTPDDFYTLNPGNPDQQGNAAVIAAGTGLGEAGLYWDGKRHHPFACEGGHVDFAPQNDLEIDLLKYLLKKFSHVSYEWIISGVGVYNIYQFLRDSGYEKEAPWFKKELSQKDAGVVITQAALKQRCPLCIKTMDMFASIYGAEAGNLALKMLALKGLYIGGGIAPKILSLIQQGSFMKAFLAKGRLKPIIETIPVKVILTDRTALLGAAVCAGRKMAV